MRRRYRLVVAGASIAAAGIIATALLARMTEPNFVPIPFEQVPGWSGDDHRAALGALRRSCQAILKRRRTGDDPIREGLSAACRGAARLASQPSRAEARAFFERYFSAHKVEGGEPGLLTGYYEPELHGARTRDERYRIPVLRRPPGYVSLIDDAMRGALNGKLTSAQETKDGLKPWPDRKSIEQGALDAMGLEILFLEDPVETFFMHIQGSGRVRLRDGSTVRLSYAGKNGHPYTAIGKDLIERGAIRREQMSAQAIKQWLKDNPKAGRELMWTNKSYIFFREIAGMGEADGPIGAQGVNLTEQRSLAVDAAYYRLGTPIFVVADDLRTPKAPGSGFRRLMIAQDVGSAIKGVQRGDIFWGSGAQAGEIAGHTKHRGTFYVLLPRPGRGAGAPDHEAAPK